MLIALPPYIIGDSLEDGNTLFGAGGQLTPSGLGDELAKLDDSEAHLLDVLFGHRLGGTGSRGCARACTGGNAVAIRGRYTVRGCARGG